MPSVADWYAYYTVLQQASEANSRTPLGDSSSIFAFAKDEANAANGYISQLGLMARALVPPVINPQFPVGYVPPAISVPPAPGVTPIVWSAPAAPPIFNTALDITGKMPEFDTLPPVIVFPTPPTPFSGDAPTSPTVNLDFVFPTLSITLPTAPTLMSLSTYTYAGPNLPTIDATIPELKLVAPSLVPYQAPKLPYSDTLLTQVQTTLMDRIKTGKNTGLPPEVEQALWDRAREKEMIASSDAIAELERMESLGYAFPPGVYVDARLKVQTDMGYKSMGLSREISITQAQLIQKTIVDAINSAVDVEKMLVDYTNKVEQLTFESCKYATEAGISIYNAQVKQYEVLVEAYKAKLAYFEAQVREQEAAVKIYQIEIEAEKLKSDMNTALVTQYEVMAKVASINVDIYKAEIEAIKIKADTQKIIVEVFGEEVKAYVAQINAFTAQVEAYRAGMMAVQTQEEVYKTQVQAYTALVEATKAQIEVKVDVMKANVSANMAAWDGYKALTVSLGEQARAISEGNQSVAAIYHATVQGTSAYNETLTKQWNVAIDQAERVTEIGVSAAKANAELFMTTRSLALDASKVGAQVSAQMGSAAIGAINWSTHYSYGDTTSKTEGKSESKSDTSSKAENHSYQDSTIYEYISQDITSA